MKSFTSFLKTPLAHRGLHDDQKAENSMAAFEAAVEHGYGIELDVHIIKDGTIVVVHDNALKRVTGFEVNVEDLTREQLAQYPLSVGQQVIPTLQGLLTMVQGRVPVLIELKVTGDFNPEIPLLPEGVLKVLEGYPNPENIAIQSFNPYVMRWLHDHQAPFMLGQLSSRKLEGQSKFVEWMFGSLNVLKISKADFIAFDILYLPSRPVARKKKKGYPILTWTVDTKEKLATARQYADNVIFEKIRL